LTSWDSPKQSPAQVYRSVLVVLVLLVSVFFRTYDLDRVPLGLDGDEMFNGWDAVRVWEGGLHVFFPANFGREPLLIYLIAFAVRVLGVGAWAVRLPSALCGVIGLTFTWALAKRLFNYRVAILTTALTSVSLWPVLLNRVALRAGLQPVCQVVAVYALWRALDDRSSWWAIVAGLFTGLNFYTYTAGRLFPLVLILWLSLSLVSVRRSLRAGWKSLALVGLFAVLVLLPLGLFALRYPETFNQRVYELDSQLNKLQAGDLRPFWRSAKAALGMFTEVGDRTWRYNPSGRPVFNKITGVFFYLGLLVSLFRLRRPAYLLLLIWLVVMLLPTILSIATPSFWHSVGALTPIYLMPAIGADFLWERATRWMRRFCRRCLITELGLSLITFAGLAFIAVDTWNDFFIYWARHPEVLDNFEADLAAAARYLNEYEPADTPVWVSSNYPGDLSRVLLNLQSTYPGPVRWFDGNQVTVWPSGWAGQDVLLVFTRSSPPNPDALAVLGDFLIYEENDGAGRSHLWVYRIPGEVLSETPWHPTRTLSGRFVSNREVLGCDVPERVERQSDVPVVVYWRVPTDVAYDQADLPFSFVCLQDGAVGRCRERESHYAAYPMWDWTVGDVVAERYTVQVPAHLLPQTTNFHVGMFTSAGDMSFAGEDQAGAPLLVGPIEVEGTASVDPQWDASTPTFNQDLALVGHGVPDERWPGSTLGIELQWQAMRSPEGDYAVRLELCEQDSNDVAVSFEELLGSERHLTSEWVSGEPAYTYHRVKIPPDMSGGEFDVYLTLLEDVSRRRVGSPLYLDTLYITGWAHSFELPEPEYPLVADFGSIIRLLGFDLGQAALAPGGQVEVVLYWQALSTIRDDYKVFVHLYNPAGDGLSGQHDSPPGNGAFPTSSWLPEEVVTDPHLAAIGPDAAVGVSKIGVGLYRHSTGERLPVFVDGQPQPNDTLIITEVEIK
jgi:4-amino-4-deoxy-L-arabinose transferase-like glycosyltransferase